MASDHGPIRPMKVGGVTRMRCWICLGSGFVSPRCGCCPRVCCPNPHCPHRPTAKSAEEVGREWARDALAAVRRAVSTGEDPTSGGSDG